jgi:uncharacterized protein with ParB-like and HNH nuclease domain
MVDTEIVDSLGDEFEEEILFDYSITAYGADYTVDSLVKRLKAGDISLPDFQRGYVWTYSQACRFIESLLLGLPVPGIFLSKEESTQKLLVIDGNQRLRTLQFFFDGVFEPSKKAFELRGVVSRFKDMTYKTLPDEARRRLDDSILHATIVRQDEPEDENSSTFLIFERLNTGGTDLQSQEIRSAIYHGEFKELLKELNRNKDWRAIYGDTSSRMRDQELLLRFLSMFYYRTKYESPMKKFLNRYMSKNRRLVLQSADELTSTFSKTIHTIHDTIGVRAFRPQGVLNAAVFDSVMVGVAERLKRGPLSNPTSLSQAYDSLLLNPDFIQASGKATAREAQLAARMKLAVDAFMNVP